MTIQEARGIAARLWCLPAHASKEMDSALAEDIAQAILEAAHHSWDIYGDDYLTRELALLALSQAPPHPRLMHLGREGVKADQPPSWAAAPTPATPSPVAPREPVCGPCGGTKLYVGPSAGTTFGPAATCPYCRPTAPTPSPVGARGACGACEPVMVSMELGHPSSMLKCSKCGVIGRIDKVPPVGAPTETEAREQLRAQRAEVEACGGCPICSTADVTVTPSAPVASTEAEAPRKPWGGHRPPPNGPRFGGFLLNEADRFKAPADVRVAGDQFCSEYDCRSAAGRGAHMVYAGGFEGGRIKCAFCPHTSNPVTADKAFTPSAPDGGASPKEKT